jgi:hypothetical protein
MEQIVARLCLPVEVPKVETTRASEEDQKLFPLAGWDLTLEE